MARNGKTRSTRALKAPPPSSGGRVVFAAYTDACGDLCELLAEAAVGRAGDASLVLAACCHELHVAVKPKQDAYIKKVEQALRDGATAFASLRRPLPSRWPNDEAKQAHLKAREEALAVAGPLYALLCDAPYDDPRVTRIMGYSDEQLCQLTRKLNANQGKPGTQQAMWKTDAQLALIANARSPVMELGAVATLCEFVGSLNLAQLSKYSIVLGGGMLTLGAAMKRRCEVCIGNGAAFAPDSNQCRGCIGASGGDGGRAMRYQWTALPLWHTEIHQKVVLVHARAACIDNELVSLPKRDGLDSEAYLASDWLSTLCTGEVHARSSPKYTPAHVENNRRILLALLRTTEPGDGADAPGHHRGPASLQVHALTRRVGRDKFHALFGNDVNAPRRTSTPLGRIIGPNVSFNGGVHPATNAWTQAFPKVWLRKHPSVPDDWTVECIMGFSPAQMCNARRRLEIEDECREMCIETARRAQRGMWERLTELLFEESGVHAPVTLPSVDLRLPGTKEAYRLIIKEHASPSLVDPVDVVGMPQFAASLGVLDGAMAAHDYAMTARRASGEAYMYASGFTSALQLAQIEEDRGWRRLLSFCNQVSTWSTLSAWEVGTQRSAWCWSTIVGGAHAFDLLDWSSLQVYEDDGHTHWMVKIAGHEVSGRICAFGFVTLPSTPTQQANELDLLHEIAANALKKAGQSDDGLPRPPAAEPRGGSTAQVNKWRKSVARSLASSRSTRAAALAMLVGIEPYKFALAVHASGLTPERLARAAEEARADGQAWPED